MNGLRYTDSVHRDNEFMDLTSLTQDESEKPLERQEKMSHGEKVLLIDRHVRIRYLSPTCAGTVHDKKIADSSPYELPVNSLILQDLGFLAFTLDRIAHANKIF